MRPLVDHEERRVRLTPGYLLLGVGLAVGAWLLLVAVLWLAVAIGRAIA